MSITVTLMIMHRANAPITRDAMSKYSAHVRSQSPEYNVPMKTSDPLSLACNI